MNIFSKISTLSLGLLALGAASFTTPAAAGGWDHHWNAPLAGGIAGGLLLGAMMSNASAAPVYDYAPDAVTCHRVRAPIYDAYGDVVGYRRVRVCD